METSPLRCKEGAYGAWDVLFKLIEQGEKEKAITLYRVIAPSISDRGRIIQGEGDIFLFFGDQVSALEKYEHAALIYYQARRFLEARAVYEHIITLNPEHHDARAYLLAIAITLDWPELFYQHADELMAWYEQQSLPEDEYRSIIAFLEGICSRLPRSQERLLTTDVVTSYCAYHESRL